MKYFIATTVCGHVGRGYAINKDFAIRANSKKEAARIARYIPRVKHDYKYAILGVKEVSYEEYVFQSHINSEDPFLNAKNSREQAYRCNDLTIYRLNDSDNDLKYQKKRKVSEKAYQLRYCDDTSWTAV